MRTRRRTLTPRQAICLLAKTALLAVLMLWAAWGAVDLAADRDLERSLEELRTRGAALRLEELMPGPVPDEENGAPYYEAASAAVRALGLYGFYPSEELADADAEERIAIHRDLEKIPEILGLVRRARSFPKCRFERPIRRGEPLRLIEVDGMHTLALLVSYRAQQQAEEGRASDAQESVRDLFALANAYRDEPTYDSQSNRFIFLEKGFSAVRWCSRRSRTEDELRGWLEVLPDAASLERSAQRAAKGELATMASLLTRRPMLPAFRRDRCFLDRIVDPFLVLSNVDGLLPLQQAVEICGLPYRDGRWPTDLLRGPRTLQILEGRIAPIDHLHERQAIAQAAIALARAGLQAEIHMMRWGGYPEEASGTDPFSGRPFIVDLEQGLIRSSGPRPMDVAALDDDNLVWRLTPR